jgi:serine/threonine protein kinase
MTPEAIQGTSYSFPADVWSIGIIIVELAEGAPPYGEYPPTKAMVEISINGFPGYRFPIMHSSEFCDFVLRCIVRAPDSRTQIPELFAHPFIKRAERLPRQEVLADLVIRVIGHGAGNVATIKSRSFRAASAEKLRSLAGNFEAMASFVKIANQDSLIIIQQVDEATRKIPTPASLSDIEFVQVARAVSEKIPFVPLKPGTVEAIDTSALYRPYSEKVDPKKCPMFNHEGVLHVQHALCSRKIPPLLAAFIEPVAALNTRYEAPIAPSVDLLPAAWARFRRAGSERSSAPGPIMRGGDPSVPSAV